MADDMGVALVRAQSRALLARVYDRTDRIADADACARESSDLLNEMARTLPDAEDRHTFMSVPWRREICARASEATSRLRALRSSGSAAAPDDSRLVVESTAGSESDSTDTPPGNPSDSAQVLSLPTPPPETEGDLRAVVTFLLESALESIACDRGMVFLIAPDGTSEIVVARKLESESIEDARSYCRSVIDRAAQGEEILVVDTARDDRFRDRRSVNLFNIVSLICVPIRVSQKVMGALYLDSRAGGRLLRDDAFQAARKVASQMAANIRVAWEREREREEALLHQKALCQTYQLDAIIGDSPAMKKVFRVLEAVIASDCNVLIVGESGTGKELAARSIHFSGRRKMARFLPLDCGALPDALVESELFGYRRGAFTGADEDKKGLFEEADGGTLFLDEITNTSTLFQAKLLRILQSGEFRRVGDTKPRSVDVRIVAATNADLEAAIRSGLFREDLFYRLNVVTVKLPPLRERREDIPSLADQFAKAYCEKEKVHYRGIGESALKRMLDYSWPGNVRELKNAIESALVLSREGAVRREFLPEQIRGGSFQEIRDLLQDGSTHPRKPAPAGEHRDPAPAEASVQGRPEGWMSDEERRAAEEDEERAAIQDALSRAGGDKTLAAKILGCSRMTLYRRMQRLGIDYSTGQVARQPVS